MLVPEKLGSFDPESKTLGTFLELLSELNSAVNIVSDISDGAEETEFYRVTVMSESSEMSENVQKKMDLCPCWERRIDLLVWGEQQRLTGKLGIRVMMWENQLGKDLFLWQQGNYCTVFPNSCICVIELKLCVKGGKMEILHLCNNNHKKISANFHPQSSYKYRYFLSLRYYLFY